MSCFQESCDFSYMMMTRSIERVFYKKSSYLNKLRITGDRCCNVQSVYIMEITGVALYCQIWTEIVDINDNIHLMSRSSIQTERPHCACPSLSPTVSPALSLSPLGQAERLLSGGSRWTPNGVSLVLIFCLPTVSLLFYMSTVMSRLWPVEYLHEQRDCG